MKEFKGISASSGVAIGKAFLYVDDVFSQIPRYTITRDEVDLEWARFLEAVLAAETEVLELLERANREMGEEQAKIFESHLMMLRDEDLKDQIQTKLHKSSQNIEWVLWDISRELTQKLSNSSDAYLQERVVDIFDVSRRILHKLLFIKKVSLADLQKEVILVTHNLLPSDALVMNKRLVKGIAMDMGGPTSHTAILARAFEIPAVLGLSRATTEIKNGDLVIVDGNAGHIICNPNKEVLERYQRMAVQLKKMAEDLKSLRDLPAETTDGYRVTLKANIEIPEEAPLALQHGAEGIGLYRSEFLFLTPGQSADEERQYRAYKQVLEGMGSLPVTIRTLDVGGDKIIPDLQATEEKNPLLGWRAIRFCLAHKEFFKTQLKALLRSSVHGNLKIMFPMISGIEELEAALAVLEESKVELAASGKAFSEKLDVGAMIEIPSAAMTADILAKKAAFFSIGTNDLVQYSLAVDRGNERIAYLAQPFHPAVLRFIKRTIDAAHEAGIPAAMCGELAGNPHATALLLGLGLDEFSMSAASIPLVKKIIRSVSLKDCQALASAALACSSYVDVENLVTQWMRQRIAS
ncbi:phosphoenolpyruvate--protein phosphotransferase [Gracilinema caldarium]|uniref:phosphoenolpyruvate--protein phosphotransferase n=1 Tax=Gracilinema caldarium TaxID=215591 RepID=UPI0026F00BC3|nr:phosphoenolpyruvate--protein phosphotransferase [Gracilinema caldarium]